MTRLMLAAVALLLVGCQETEPYGRAHVWQPTGANAGNLNAMAVRSSDLIRGRGKARADARQGADAVDRVWQSRTRALPTASSISPQIAVSTTAPQPGVPN